MHTGHNSLLRQPSAPRRPFGRSFTPALLCTGAVALTQAGCVISSMEVINTDRVYLLGPKTESSPGPPTRVAAAKAVDTNGTLAFHVDRAKECTVTSTPRYQKVHIEGRKAKDLTGAVLTGSLLLAAGGGLIGASTVVDDGSWMKPKFSGSNDQEITDAGLLGIIGIIMGGVGLVVLPRAIYHAAASDTEVTGGAVVLGVPPKGAVRAPEGYDPKHPQTVALVPRTEQPRFGILDFGAASAGELRKTGSLDRLSPSLGAPKTRAFQPDLTLLAVPRAGGDNDAPSGAAPEDEYTQVVTRTEVCERRGASGVAIALVVKDTDGVLKTIDIGKTDSDGDVERDVLKGLESAFSGWPSSKQAVLKEAKIVPLDEPSTVLGELDLEKYPALKYTEHAVSTRKAREALAAAEAAKREAEAKAREDALHADERKAEAAKKAAACMQQAQSRCSADCQGNQACVKKCMQKVSCH